MPDSKAARALAKDRKYKILNRWDLAKLTRATNPAGKEKAAVKAMHELWPAHMNLYEFLVEDAEKFDSKGYEFIRTAWNEYPDRRFIPKGKQHGSQNQIRAEQAEIRTGDRDVLCDVCEAARVVNGEKKLVERQNREAKRIKRLRAAMKTAGVTKQQLGELVAGLGVSPVPDDVAGWLSKDRQTSTHKQVLAKLEE